MIAAFDDPAMLQHHNGVSVSDSGQAMGNEKNSASFHELIHAPFDEGFGTGVDGAGGLVENEHRRVGDGGPCDGQKLALSLAQVCSVGCQHRVIALGEMTDKEVGVGQLGGGVDFLVGGVETAVTDIIGYQ